MRSLIVSTSSMADFVVRPKPKPEAIGKSALNQTTVDQVVVLLLERDRANCVKLRRMGTDSKDFTEQIHVGGPEYWLNFAEGSRPLGCLVKREHVARDWDDWLPEPREPRPFAAREFDRGPGNSYRSAYAVTARVERPRKQIY